MSITEVRNRFHALIDEVEDPALLLSFFEIISRFSKNKHRNIWDTISESDKKEVLDAYEESKNDTNLLSHQKVMSRYIK